MYTNAKGERFAEVDNILQVKNVCKELGYYGKAIPRNLYAIVSVYNGETVDVRAPFNPEANKVNTTALWLDTIGDFDGESVKKAMISHLFDITANRLSIAGVAYPAENTLLLHELKIEKKMQVVFINTFTVYPGSIVIMYCDLSEGGALDIYQGMKPSLCNLYQYFKNTWGGNRDSTFDDILECSSNRQREMYKALSDDGDEYLYNLAEFENYIACVDNMASLERQEEERRLQESFESEQRLYKEKTEAQEQFLKQHVAQQQQQIDELINVFKGSR